jgi:spore coat polysaccharide biosynthesis protein SpsF (cytidylyltransferase family)
MLDWAHTHADEAYDREHVFTVFDQTGFNKVNVATSPDRSDIEWTLDTLEDYVRIWSVFKSREEAA